MPRPRSRLGRRPVAFIGPHFASPAPARPPATMVESPREGVPERQHEFGSARAADVDVRRPRRPPRRPAAARAHRRGALRVAITRHGTPEHFTQPGPPAASVYRRARLGSTALRALRREALPLHGAGAGPGVFHRRTFRAGRQRQARDGGARSRRRHSVAGHAAPGQGSQARGLRSGRRARVLDRRSGGPVNHDAAPDTRGRGPDGRDDDFRGRRRARVAAFPGVAHAPARRVSPPTSAAPGFQRAGALY